MSHRAGPEDIPYRAEQFRSKHLRTRTPLHRKVRYFLLRLLDRGEHQ